MRNLPDGTVEAVFEGPPHDVARLVDWTRHGPAGADVRDVEVREEPVEGLPGFEIRRTPWWR